MPDRLYPSDDFEALIRIYRPEEGGRRTLAANGIRWDFAYADDSPTENLYGIYPDFFSEDGSSFPKSKVLPIGMELAARMFILVKEQRDFHSKRIAPGVRFYCHEGPKRVAEGVVTRITGLPSP